MSEFASDKKADTPSSSSSNPTSIPFVQTRAVPASQVGTLTAADLRKPDGSSLPLDWTNMGVGADDDCHPLRLPIDVVDQDAFDPEVRRVEWTAVEAGAVVGCDELQLGEEIARLLIQHYTG